MYYTFQWNNTACSTGNNKYIHSPGRMKLAVAFDGFLLDTVNWYSPPSVSVTVRVWVYCAVSGSSNTVIPPETVSESLVQVTLVAGPPVEIEVRVNRGLSPLRSEFTVTFIQSSCMMTSPEERNINEATHV